MEKKRTGDGGYIYLLVPWRSVVFHSMERLCLNASGSRVRVQQRVVRHLKRVSKKESARDLYSLK